MSIQEAPWEPAQECEVLDSPFNLAELTCTISSLRLSAPGRDGVTAPLLRNLPKEAVMFLLALFNASWRTGHIPQVWREGIVVPILKPGKAPSVVAHFRPITLLSVVGKVLERMILRRLQWWLSASSWWSPSVHGGLRGRSVMSAVDALVGPIQMALRAGESMAVEILDMTKAYDRILPQTIVNSLRTANISPGALRWLTTFMTERSACVRVGDCYSELFPVSRGVPQGSSLSPILFAMGTNDLGPCLPSPVTVQYIDDVAVGGRGRSPEAALATLQSANEVLLPWADKRGLSFQAEKSVVMIFTKRAYDATQINIHLGDCSIPLCPTARYLGVILDSTLSWSAHVAALRVALRKRHNLLRVLAGKKWGASTAALRQVYCATVQPILDFGIAFYGSAAASVLRRLDTEIHRGLRIVTGLPISTSLPALFVEAGVLPPALRREQQSLSTEACMPPRVWGSFSPSDVIEPRAPRRMSLVPLAHRVRYWTTAESLRGSSLMVSGPTEAPPWSYVPLRRLACPGFIKGNTTPFNSSLLASWIESLGSPVTVYTDASVGADGYTAAGFWVPECNVLDVVELPRGLSIYAAELQGVLRAASWIASHLYPRTAVILCDSLGVVTMLSTDNCDPVESLRSKIWHTLHSVGPEGSQATIAWVPSHSSIAGNDRIDFEVSRVRPLKCHSPSLPAPDRRAIVRSAVSGVWANVWRMQTTALSRVRPDLHMYVRSVWPNRAWETSFARARADRLPTRENRFKWGQIREEECPICSVVDSINHRIVSCPRASVVRARLQARFPEVRGNSSLLVSTLLGVGQLAKHVPFGIYFMMYGILRAV